MKDYREMAEDVLKRRDAYVAERKKRMRKTVSAVSCVCLAALLGIGGWYGSRGLAGPGEELDGGGLDGDPQGYSVGVSDPEKMSDSQTEQGSGEMDPLAALAQRRITEAGARASGEKDSVQRGAAETEARTSCEADAPAVDSPVSEGNLKAYEAVWGGSYVDSEGRTVVLLTEDTEENRQEVFERNPDLLESSTVFQKAEYSLKYLTKLQEAISEMMADKELPFVTESALLEDANCIRVTMTTDSQEELERLMAVDSLGGAIVVEYSQDRAVKEDLTTGD